MNATNLGRREFGRHGYDCDCQACANCEPTYIPAFECDPNECSFRRVDLESIPHREWQRSFSAGVFLVAALGGTAMLILAAIMEWLTR